MTEHQSLPVHGYRSQNEITVAIVNGNKKIEEHTLQILDHLKLDADVDQRWLAIGRTAIEQGWMAVNRAVFKPSRVVLPKE